MTLKVIDSTSGLVDQITQESEEIAKTILQEWQGWLESAGLSAKAFCETLRNKGWQDCSGALGITQEQFFEGINSISSLTLYALIVDAPTVEHLWKGFEVNKYICPQWLTEALETAMQDVFSQSCMAAPPSTQSDGNASTLNMQRQIVEKCIQQYFQSLMEQES